MYYPQSPREPSGCMQTLVITRVILVILAVPLLIIIGAVLAVVLTFYALSVSPFLALLVILLFGGAIALAVRWEMRRVAKEMPADEDR